MDTRQEHSQWLTLLHGWNPPLRELVHRLQGRHPQKRLEEMGPEALAGLPPKRVDPRAAGCEAAVAADLRWLDRDPGTHHLLPITDPCYPWLLREIADPPLLLFLEGDRGHLNQPCLAIVGSRNPTPQGRDTAWEFGRALARAGFIVVSGLARGIDGAAHQGALETGHTIAVCGHGLDHIYPVAHRRLRGRIRAQGALLSEFPTGAPPLRPHFPRRNRLISGLSVGTLVVEAGIKSGSLITARLAAEQNREVFAVPGPIQSPQSKGCHALIRNGVTLVESIQDILRELGHFSDRQQLGDTSGEPEPAHEHAWLLDHMGYAPCTRDELVKRSGLTSAEVSSMLLALELGGSVELCPGGTYVRVTRS